MESKSYMSFLTSGEAIGTVGVLTYDIAETDYKVAIMWSVPFDFNLYDIWFNIKVRQNVIGLCFGRQFVLQGRWIRITYKNISAPKSF